MRVTCLFLLAFLTIAPAGCGIVGKKERPAYGSWKLQDVEAIGNADFDQTVKLKGMLKDGAQISFFKDGSYTFVSGKGEYVYGKWSESGNEIVFQPADERFERSVIQRQERDGKAVLKLVKEDNATSYIFVADALPLEKEADDPFHPSNNKWRIKPGEKESEAAIKARLKNYIRHYALILKAAKDRNQQVVFFEFSQGPVKIYSSAIGIHPFLIIPDEWMNCFYNRTDAADAYALYQQALEKESYRGASAGNWIDDDYNILLSIYGALN